jgi:hypothetical protein
MQWFRIFDITGALPDKIRDNYLIKINLSRNLLYTYMGCTKCAYHMAPTYPTLVHNQSEYPKPGSTRR